MHHQPTLVPDPDHEWPHRCHHPGKDFQGLIFTILCLWEKPNRFRSKNMFMYELNRSSFSAAIESEIWILKLGEKV